jgi:wyosine [tRNA(Phe)-imidazoG37] synthetase (radical SAM superfamily)
VPSWRFGSSLGVDPVCRRKVCTFDCAYCQLGRTTEKTAERREFISPRRLEEDLRAALGKRSPDIVTFSGTGEPTLASNLGELARVAKSLTGLPVAILTNSSLLPDAGVREDLMAFDVVSAKIDAATQRTFERVNQPLPGITLSSVLDGLREFREAFRGKLYVQSMFIAENKGEARGIAAVCKGISPQKVHLDTPFRPALTPPLGREEMAVVAAEFSGLNAVNVYDVRPPKAVPIDETETSLRRPG